MTLQLRLVSDLRLGFEGPRARARTTLHEGERAFVALAWSTPPLPTSFEEAALSVARTSRFWQEWLKHGSFPDHPWRQYLQRSALTLKGLTYAPSGAMVAAATTSLPETPGGDRNWDYRYSWIRDSTFMLWALYTLGFDEEANDFFYFIADLAETEEGQLQVMYGIGGESRLDERGVFVQHYETKALDASLLLMPLVRFLPPEDVRIRATVLAIADELTEDGLVLRYRVAETDDGFAGEEGTFTICSFWLVSALAEIGEIGRARRLCEKLLSHASSLALYAEQLDPASGRHLGNFPQAFTHLALINAVVHIIRAEQQLALRA